MKTNALLQIQLYHDIYGSISIESQPVVCSGTFFAELAEQYGEPHTISVDCQLQHARDFRPRVVALVTRESNKVYKTESLSRPKSP